MRKRKKKITYIRSIILGFTLLYLTTMLFTTYLVQENFMNNYLKRADEVMYAVRNGIIETSSTDKESLHKEMELLLNTRITAYTKYQQISGAIYGPDGNLIAKTTPLFVSGYDDVAGKMILSTHKLSDYLTEKELEEVLPYYEACLNTNQYEEEDPYKATTWFDKETQEPLMLTIYESANQQIVWSWKNPDFPDLDASPNSKYYTKQTQMSLLVCFRLPCATYGLKYWEKWAADEHLQSFENTFIPEVTTDSFGLSVSIPPSTDVGMINVPSPFSNYAMDGYYLRIRHTVHPWLAAMDYMKDIYVYGFLMMSLCIAIVLYTTIKTHKKQTVLEESRRDFTNAIAHELKTPLGIIRGFAENLQENTESEKREYYLSQIENQTRHIGSAIEEMLTITELNSDEFIMETTPLSILSIIQEQYHKLLPLAQSKSLDIYYDIKQEFQITGSKTHMEKAIWNLLSNAIEYNVSKGKIRITVDDSSCSIENTGLQIPDDDLPHVCEMFYTGNKSRTSTQKHLGLGLYLAKRIFDMHKIQFTIENTEIGVKVTLKK